MSDKDRWLFVSDMDDTLLGDAAALEQLIQALSEASNEIVLVYNSSRPCDSLRQTLAEYSILPTPDYLVGAMGTQIQKGESEDYLEEYTERIDKHWFRYEVIDVLDDLQLIPHSPKYQTQFKVSYTIPEGISDQDVIDALEYAYLDVKVFHVKGTNLDVIPQTAGKGEAVNYLRELVQVSPDRVVVAGDSANDLDMFQDYCKGIIVANATPILKRLQGDHIYHAQAACAGGVLEGLRFWGVL